MCSLLQNKPFFVTRENRWDKIGLESIIDNEWWIYRGSLYWSLCSWIWFKTFTIEKLNFVYNLIICKGKAEREPHLPSAVSSSKWPQWLALAQPRPKPGAQSSIQLSHVDDRGSHSQAILHCLPSHVKTGSWIGIVIAGLKSHVKQWVNLLHHSAIPNKKYTLIKGLLVL